MVKSNDLLERYRTTQDQNIKEELLKKWLPYVRWVAERFVVFLPPCIDMEDIISQGIVGLLNAINTFDPQKGVDFKTYAFYRIKGAILDELRTLDWKPRSVDEKIKKLDSVYSKLENKLGRMPTEDEIAKELAIGKKELYKLLREARAPELLSFDLHPEEHEIIPNSEPHLLQVIQEEEARRTLLSAINALPEREKLLITLYYYEDLTLKEIGEIIGVSESRVSQIHIQLLLHLKNVLKRLI